jgi:peptidoglycan/LPS O-acetylase OafA/YrhL
MADQLVSVDVPTTRPGGRSRREDWLDAVRCIAILGVAFDHFAVFLIPDWTTSIRRIFELGAFLMALFFLVTGYGLTMSLQRRPGLHQFWAARVFRIYPLLLVAAVPIIFVGWLGNGLPPTESNMQLTPPELRQDPFITLLANGLMLPRFLGVSPLVGFMWFLSYMMAFYFLITVLVVTRLERFNTEIATGFAAFSLFVGGLLPTGALAASVSAARPLTITVSLILLVAMTAIFNQRRWAQLSGAVAIAGLILTLLAVNQPEGPWYGFIVLAMMFAGAAVCQARLGQISRAQATAVFIFVVVCAGAASVIHRDLWQVNNGSAMAAGLRWTAGIILAAIVFLAGLAIRERRLPRFVTWTGRISYSIFFLHFGLVFALVLWWYDTVREGSVYVQIAALIAYFAVLIPICYLNYKWIEAPGQRLGRRLADRKHAREPGGMNGGPLAGPGRDSRR